MVKPDKQAASARRWVVLVTVLAMVAATASRGDTVLTRQAKSIRDVTVVGFNQARLEVVDKGTGQRQTIDFDQIASIRVDGKSVLNRAETFLTLKKRREAIDAYRVALTKSPGAWEHTWIQVRLFRLLAQTGQIESAADVYVDLAERVGEWVMQVAPARNEIPAERAALQKAAATLVEARKVSGSTPSRQALTKFLERLGYDQPTWQPADPNVVEMTEADLIRLHRPGTWLDTWAEKQAKARQYDRIAKMTDTLFTHAVRADMPVILYWRGRAHLALKQYDPAALELLRVAIEFPTSPYAPYGLYHAADAMSKANRALYAKTAREELIARYANSRDVVVSQLVSRTKTLLSKPEKSKD